MGKIIKNKKLRMIMIAFFVTFALALSLNLVDETKVGINKNTNVILKMLIKLEESINKDVLESISIFGITYFLLNKEEVTNNQKNDKRGNILKIVLAIFFAIFTILGYSYSKTNSWNLIFNGKVQLLKSIIKMLGYIIIFKLIIDYIFNYIIPNIKYEKSNSKVINFIFEKHSFIIPIAIILICWIPYLISFYPGIVTSDATNQIKQFYGIEIDENSSTNSTKLIDENVKITNHHPVVHTAILGICLKLGKLIGNENFGIFLYTISQTLLLACTLAYIINFMKKLKTNNYIRIATLVFFALMPVFPFTGLEITKDVPFTSFILIYMVELYKIMRFYKSEKISIKKMSFLTVLCLLICLFRNNGLYIILLSLPFSAIVNKINWKRIIVSTLIVFFIYEAFIKIVLPILKIANGGIQEALSIPFQQTARYVRDYEYDVTEEEKNIIDKILNYKTLASRYEPERSDAVKNRYNKEATKEDLKKYFKVWAKQLFRHPDAYIEAYINNYYGYFCPETNTVGYNTGDITKANNGLSQTNEFNYDCIKCLWGSRNALTHIMKISEKIPIISLTVNTGFNTWIILGILVFLIYKREYKYLIYLLPSLAILLVCCASPVNRYLRYDLPNILGITLLISIFLDIIKKDEEEA